MLDQVFLIRLKKVFTLFFNPPKRFILNIDFNGFRKGEVWTFLSDELYPECHSYINSSGKDYHFNSVLQQERFRNGDMIEF